MRLCIFYWLSLILLYLKHKCTVHRSLNNQRNFCRDQVVLQYKLILSQNNMKNNKAWALNIKCLINPYYTLLAEPK